MGNGVDNNSQQAEGAEGSEGCYQTPGNKLSWAQITKLHRPASCAVPLLLLEKIRNWKSEIGQQHMRVRPETKPTAVYFKNVRRRPIGVLIRALSKCLPGWAILGLCFAGGSILKVITDVRQKIRLTVTIKIMGIVEVPDFDIAKSTKKRQIGENQVSPEDRSELPLNRRIKYCIENCRNTAAKSWYANKLNETTMSHQMKKRAVPDVECSPNITRDREVEDSITQIRV